MFDQTSPFHVQLFDVEEVCFYTVSIGQLKPGFSIQPPAILKKLKSDFQSYHICIQDAPLDAIKIETFKKLQQSPMLKLQIKRKHYQISYGSTIRLTLWFVDKSLKIDTSVGCILSEIIQLATDRFGIRIDDTQQIVIEMQNKILPDFTPLVSSMNGKELNLYIRNTIEIEQQVERQIQYLVILDKTNEGKEYVIDYSDPKFVVLDAEIRLTEVYPEVFQITHRPVIARIDSICELGELISNLKSDVLFLYYSDIYNVRDQRVTVNVGSLNNEYNIEFYDVLGNRYSIELQASHDESKYIKVGDFLKKIGEHPTYRNLFVNSNVIYEGKILERNDRFPINRESHLILTRTKNYSITNTCYGSTIGMSMPSNTNTPISSTPFQFTNPSPTVNPTNSPIYNNSRKELDSQGSSNREYSLQQLQLTPTYNDPYQRPIIQPIVTNENRSTPNMNSPQQYSPVIQPQPASQSQMQPAPIPSSPKISSYQPQPSSQINPYQPQPSPQSPSNFLQPPQSSIPQTQQNSNGGTQLERLKDLTSKSTSSTPIVIPSNYSQSIQPSYPQQPIQSSYSQHQNQPSYQQQPIQSSYSQEQPKSISSRTAPHPLIQPPLPPQPVRISYTTPRPLIQPPLFPGPVQTPASNIELGEDVDAFVEKFFSFITDNVLNTLNQLVEEKGAEIYKHQIDSRMFE